MEALMYFAVGAALLGLGVFAWALCLTSARAERRADRARRDG